MSTRVIKVGNKLLGGNNPILIQTMADIKTSKVDEVVKEAQECEKIGADLIRFSVLDDDDIEGLKIIKRNLNIPIVADIHFDYLLAIKAINAGVDKIRINPGNIPDKYLKEIVFKAKDKNIPIRIGINSGSYQIGSNPDKFLNELESYIQSIERFGYNNVGFHLGADYCTMDFDGTISKEQLKEIEAAANEAVYQDLEIEILYPSKDELKDMDYRSKIEIEGQVRIVKIPGYDVCACCAPHVKTTGEIGAVKLVSMANYKGGERITMLCGRRAMRDYEKKDAMTKEISALLCAKEYEVADAVGKLKDEQTRMKSQIAELQQKLLEFRVAEIPVEEKIVTVFDSALSGNLPREMMNRLLDKGAVICAVFAGTDTDGYRYVIGSRSEDVRPISKALNVAFEGRGGGKPEMVQGSVKGTGKAMKELLMQYK